MEKLNFKFKIKYGKTIKELSRELCISEPTISKWDSNGFDIYKRAKELHVLKNSTTYLKQTWRNMKCRCENSNSPVYKKYGAKGIKLKMLKSELLFLWKRDKGHLLKKPSIDRINTQGHYELNNCRFIELSENIKRKESKGRPGSRRGNHGKFIKQN